MGVPYVPPNTDDPIGELFTFGTTWYDIQHNCTCGRQIQVDNYGWIHMTWMNGLNSGASQRHIFYNIMNPAGSIVFTGGVQVDQMAKSGYTTLAIGENGMAFPAFHQGQGGTYNYHTGVSNDFMPHIGSFSTSELPWVYEFSNDLEVIWPKCAIDIDGRIHTVSTENPASGVAGDPQRQYYGWAEYNPVTFSLEVCDEQEEIAWTTTIAADIAASPVSNRVAIGRLEFCATGQDTNQYDNNLIICISEDGIIWNWNDTINVTNWIPPDLSYLPDTAMANRDTIRCYADISLVFDYNDVLHAFFSTRGYYPIQGTISNGNGYIWHWDELNNCFSMVADGWFDNGFASPGAWNTYAQRASASVDSTTGDIYCMYQRLMHPLGYSGTYPFPYLHGDTTDFSLGGWPNGEIWVTKSIDGGISWAEGIDITNTHSPMAPAGNCQSEITPSMALQVYNNNLHIFYIIDKDAGAVAQSEGTWTLNDAIYHRVPISEIPATPVLPAYPMHCDSTGMPGWTPPPPPDVTVDLLPYGSPIVIPANGGSFEFNIAVMNLEGSPITFDIWTLVTLPPGNEYGPIINVPDFNAPAGWSGNRDRTQTVPAGAPTGMYTYDAYVGIYPDDIWDEDHFDFEKSATGDGLIVADWSNWGEEFGDFSLSSESKIPSEFVLHPLYPNPFNPTATIRYKLPTGKNVLLLIYDVMGREVAKLVDGYKSAGTYEITFDGSDLASGMYFVRLEAGEFTATQKLLLIK